MNRILVILSFSVIVAIGVIDFPDSGVAALLALFLSLIVIYFIKQTDKNNDFLINIFLVALIGRLLFGAILHFFELREFFGPDARMYDFLGNRLKEIWFGQYTIANDPLSERALSTSGPGWGMNYLVGIIYSIIGQNVFAAQTFCGVIGAATAPLVYICSYKIFQNQRVGKISAILVAFFPAFIIWSGQLLKDGLIIFLLVLTMTMVLELQKKFNYFAIFVLIFSLFGIISLRFYIFYMVAIAVAGSFIVGVGDSVKAIVRGFVALILMGIGLTYFGVLRTASVEIEKYGSLERVQLSRQDLSTADSGFGEDLDVSTTEGAILALPVGLTYLMLAPFPWDARNLRQAITIPETFIWWASIPFLITGLFYTLKNRLRASIAILIFTVMLTLAYSIFQGNVGTAYRQRTQIQVFLFIFIAVGWTLLQERRENKIIQREIRKQRLDEELKKRRLI